VRQFWLLPLYTNLKFSYGNEGGASVPCSLLILGASTFTTSRSPTPSSSSPSSSPLPHLPRHSPPPPHPPANLPSLSASPTLTNNVTLRPRASSLHPCGNVGRVSIAGTSADGGGAMGGVAGGGGIGNVVAFCVGGLNPRQKDSIPRDHDLNKQCYFLYSVTHYYYYYY
jgi:hypothetical protein